MFLGEYRHAIDDKGRLTIPARFRPLLAEGAFITQGLDRTLMVLRPGAFEAMSKRVNQMSVTNSNARELRRVLFGNAERVEPDKSGRILLPQFLRDIAQLNSEAVLVGMGTYFEIWSSDHWDLQSKQLEAAKENAEYFSELDLFTEED